MHTIKPLDKEAVLQAAAETGALVTAEEHWAAGGLGSAVAEVLAQNAPTPLEMVAVGDVFGRSGKAMELLADFGLGAESIAAAVKRVLARKR
jgi:transketolase